MKMRRTQLIIEGGAGKRRAVNADYVTGTDIHLTIMTHKDQVLKLCPTIEAMSEGMNELATIKDSVKLLFTLMKFEVITRIIPHRMTYTDPNDPAAKKPRISELIPKEHSRADATGLYVFQIQESKAKTQLWLFAAVALMFFFLLFRVWPDWLKQGVWYLSWYTLCFLVVTAVVRAIVWFAIFHIGLDFWIFPNYFIDSDNILDSFWPILSLNKREDMFDVRMLLVRIASAYAIFYGAQEFMKDPENLDDMVRGGGEIWDEMYDWGHHKFMGTVDPNQQIEVKKSARQIYAEAFMDDENPMFRRSTHFADYADEDAMREAYEEEQKLTDEERARRQLDDLLEEEKDGEGNEATKAATEDSQPKEGDEATTEASPVNDDANTEATSGEEEEEDLLDKLTGNIDEEEEE